MGLVSLVGPVRRVAYGYLEMSALTRDPLIVVLRAGFYQELDGWTGGGGWGRWSDRHCAYLPQPALPALPALSRTLVIHNLRPLLFERADPVGDRHRSSGTVGVLRGIAPSFDAGGGKEVVQLVIADHRQACGKETAGRPR